MELKNNLGKHSLIEFYNCNTTIINDEKYIRDVMVTTAGKSGATVVNASFHCFSPHGVSGVVVVMESHFAIHTWPEYGFASVDIYTCGDSVNVKLACELLKNAFEADEFTIKSIERGDQDRINKYLLNK